jgi:DNA-binding MarR family transcriptional regulator
MESKASIIGNAMRTLLRVLNKHAQLEAVPVRLQDGTSITHKELHALEAIGETTCINITDLGEKSGVTKSAASQMVTRLAGKGLVRKQRAEDNNKEYQLELTPAGYEAFRLHERIHGEHLADVMARLDVFSLSQIATMSMILDVLEGVVDARIETKCRRR